MQHMSKERSQKKNIKKKALLTPKEKKAAKRTKKESQSPGLQTIKGKS